MKSSSRVLYIHFPFLPTRRTSSLWIPPTGRAQVQAATSKGSGGVNESQTHDVWPTAWACELAESNVTMTIVLLPLSSYHYAFLNFFCFEPKQRPRDRSFRGFARSQLRTQFADSTRHRVTLLALRKAYPPHTKRASQPPSDGLQAPQLPAG